jgi:hypothetical protein
MNDERRWWFCLKHNRVEPEAGCPGKDRLGPYRTQEEASHALEIAKRRSEEWDAADGN